MGVQIEQSYAIDKLATFPLYNNLWFRGKYNKYI
jgi:hypothetical protein